MKVAIALATLITFAASAASAEDWREKATRLVAEEDKVVEAMWSQDESFWVSMKDNGGKRDGFAEYLCMSLSMAGKPEGKFVAITIWDQAQIVKNNLVKIGYATCQ